MMCPDFLGLETDSSAMEARLPREAGVLQSSYKIAGRSRCMLRTSKAAASYNFAPSGATMVKHLLEV